MFATSGSPHATLTAGQVHLWLLPGDRAEITRWRADADEILSPDEKQRRDGMKQPRVTDRFVMGRILLRRVLSQYVNMDPAALRFRYNANGKPDLADHVGPDISFNLSHSTSEIILAVAAGPAIGVDLEAVDRADAARRISHRFFSPAEIRQLETLETGAAARALVLWSLKESIVKAAGETVWDGLENISLAIDGPRIVWQSARHAEALGWHLTAGTFGRRHILALAVKLSSGWTGRPPVFRTFRYGSDKDQPDGFEPEFRT